MVFLSHETGKFPTLNQFKYLSSVSAPSLLSTGEKITQWHKLSHVTRLEKSSSLVAAVLNLLLFCSVLFFFRLSIRPLILSLTQSNSFELLDKVEAVLPQLFVIKIS